MGIQTKSGSELVDDFVLAQTKISDSCQNIGTQNSHYHNKIYMNLP
jgi:hypothetical protein